MIIVLVECVSAMTVREIIPAEWELSAVVNSRNEKGEKRNYKDSWESYWEVDKATGSHW